MDDSLLKDTHPQKYYFKVICKMMYFIGMGECWYEAPKASFIRENLYKAWFYLANGFLCTVICNEFLAYCRNLTDREKTDLMQFCIAHPLVYSKILALYYNRERVIVVIERLLEGPRSIFYSLELERASMRTCTKYCVTLTVTVYMTLFLAAADAIGAHIKEGVPITTEVVYYPSSANSGVFVNVLRFFMELHWYYMMAMMICIDSLCLCALVTVGCKFKVLQVYFHDLRSKMLENKEKKTRDDLEEEYKRDFVTGIKLHEDILWCAHNVQKSMGPIYSIQVFESVALLVMCLIKLVGAERNLSYLLTQMLYMAALILLTGSYMMAAGDITYEASMVPTSMFYSGWDLIRARSDFRVLAVVALQRSQVPVQMTAFGVITLSYTNFIMVLRSSYSFFAVVY
ncbi:uncharacterized protein LOC142978846 [Anticarsia gemmatalis]|uniref:uncharacterized protein LOC142978846 n=1 Tax=Anticarsia gemmatalis TaxID=129554 RepID=UPI003F77350A